jgi:hypothetical protein
MATKIRIAAQINPVPANPNAQSNTPSRPARKENIMPHAKPQSSPRVTFFSRPLADANISIPGL